MTRSIVKPHRLLSTLLTSILVMTAYAPQAQEVVELRIGSSVPKADQLSVSDRSTEPAEQVRLWRRLPFAQLCILPNCAHAAHLEQPEIFHQLLSRFLAEA
jgi:hypothetical protein